jgi:hypothetical protein
MVLRAAQSQQCGQARCDLLSTQSLPHNLAGLYSRTSPFRFTDLDGIVGPCLNEVKFCLETEQWPTDDESTIAAEALMHHVQENLSAHGCIPNSRWRFL